MLLHNWQDKWNLLNVSHIQHLLFQSIFKLFWKGDLFPNPADCFVKSPGSLPGSELKQESSPELWEPGETVNDPLWGFLLQGAKALALSLVADTSIIKLDLGDNWLLGEGAAAIAEMLRENCYISGLYYPSSSSLVHLFLLCCRGGNCAGFVNLANPTTLVTAFVKRVRGLMCCLNSECLKLWCFLTFLYLCLWICICLYFCEVMISLLEVMI